MAMQRTGGMTTIGILNIIMGAFFGLLCLLMVIGGGVLLSTGGAIGGTDGLMAAAGGRFVMLVGIVGTVIWTMMLISGIGVLMLRPWARVLAMVCGAFVIVLNGLSLYTTFAFIPMIGFAYGAVLCGMFMKPSWKAAFAGEAGASPVSSSSDDDIRAAA